MRLRRFTTGFAAMAMLATAPAIAQQQTPQQAQKQTEQRDEGARGLLRGVIGAILGPDKKADEAPAPVAAPATPTLDDVLAHPRRGSDALRDRYRHPKETLEFFQIRPGMSVVDYVPSGGWYGRILIPYLGQNGTYIGLNPYVGPEMTEPYWEKYRHSPQMIPYYASQWMGGDTGAHIIGINANDVPDELSGTVDRVVIFREFHQMRDHDWLHESLLAFRKLLKSDGMLGLVQHRAPASAPSEYVLGGFGYQREQDVIGILSAYGFELVGRSEINANPRDPANWAEGVWALPPLYRGAETSAEKQRRGEIGESDRMTLLFRKRP